MATTTYDPVSVEIHRRALDNITAEMAITLTRTSGSPVVYEVRDFATCVMDTKGEHLSMSSAVLFHSGSSLLGTQTVIAAAEAAGEVKPGQGWVINDPLEAGAAHQADITIIMPQFYKGEHISWAFANVHVADIGGMGISGFAPGAVSCYDEGLRFGPTPIITDNALDPIWEKYIRDNIRVPDLVLNDVRGMIAANNVAQRKLVEMIDRFGFDTFYEYCEINQRLTEETLRERIAKLPDGVYEANEFVEFDGHGVDRLYEARVKMTIDGSDIRFALSGDPQADAFINGSKGVIYGAAMTTVLTVLAYGDLPFNAGMWRPFSFGIGEPGTIVNAEMPAPVSAGHATTGLRVTKAIKAAFNQALALSDDPVLRSRVAGMPGDAPGLFPLVGKGHGGHPTVVFFMDINTGNGGGAQTMMDGQDSYGATTLVGVGLPSVETNEATAPALYLWRRLLPNSGGAGIYRGGQALEVGLTVYDTDRLAGGMTLFCAEAPPHGAGGGMPAATGSWDRTFDTNIEAAYAAGNLPTKESVTGETPAVPSHMGRLVLEPGDLLRVAGLGAGGSGDPLLRDPAKVKADVDDRYITVANARVAYGVVLDGAGEVDAAATEKLRARFRRERIGGEPTAEQRLPEMPGVSVTASAAGHWQCCHCDADLGPVEEDWRDPAVTRESKIADRFAELGMYIKRREGDSEFVLQEHFCPGCAGLLMAETFPGDRPRLPIARLAR